MRGLLDDVKHALRLYRRAPGASLMVVAVLAVGMAFVAAFLSLYSDLILRPEPGFERGGGRIVSVGASDGRNAGGLPRDLIERIAEDVNTLTNVAGTSPQQFQLGAGRELAMGELVTKDFFPGLRPILALGRGFEESEHDAEGEPVVVISWQYWQDQFAGRPDVLGQTIEIGGPPSQPVFTMTTSGGSPSISQSAAPEPELPVDFRIVGVMGREFAGTLPNQDRQFQTRFWMPVERGFPMTVPAALRAQPGPMAQMLTTRAMRGVGRLKPGVSTAAAASELDSRFADEPFLQQRPGMRYEVMDRIVQNIFIQSSTKRQLQLFLGGSVLLALVAAANVSLFLLARAPGRRRELGIRMAVGAPMRRLMRQLASEAAVLVVAAAVLGLGLSIWLAQYLRGLSFLRQAQWRDVTLLDWRVLVLVGIFLLLLALLVSLAPVLGLKKLGIAASSRQVSARATPAQRVAGTAQIAVAGMLGGAAVAFGWHLASMLLEDPGYRTDLLGATYSLRVGSGPIMISSDGQIAGVVDASRRREAFAAIPGVTAVSLGSAAPGLVQSSMQMMVPDPFDPAQRVRVSQVVVDSSYVDLLGLRLMPGARNITDAEPGSVLVNQTFARRFFGREDVVGEAVPTMSALPVPGARGMQIVGVLEDLSYAHPLADIDPTVYSMSSNLGFGVVLIESTLSPAVLQKQFQEVAQTLDLNMPGNVMSLAEARRNLLAPDRARGLLTIFTAALVVLLAAFGFYGTQRYLVTAGRREYAIRASLGAGPRALGRLVFKRGLLLGLPGLILGLPLAFILVAWLRDDYTARAVSPLAVTAVVALGLMVLLLAASLGPARLARNTQPAPLLRED